MDSKRAEMENDCNIISNSIPINFKENGKKYI